MNFINNLEEKLTSEYPEILEAIRKEGYNLEFMEYDIFHEIIYKNQVVGFITFERYAFSPNIVYINEAYVIPNFRGENILYGYLFNFIATLDNFQLYARKPTRAFINVLLKNGLAFMMSSNIAVSYLKFFVNPDEVYKNPKIKRFYKKTDSPFFYKANLFDIDLSSVMFADPVGEIVKYGNFFAITEPRKYDLKKYKLRKKLKKVTEGYIDECYTLWDVNYGDIEEFNEECDMQIADYMQIDNLIGSEDELSEIFTNSLDEAGLSVDDGFKIRNHIIERLESGELTSTSYYPRIAYLLENFDAVDRQIGEFDDSAETCPFCGEKISDNYRSCLKCGLHVRELDFEEHAAQKLENTFESFQKSLEKLMSSDFSDEVPIEENDDLYDLKVFYNTHMMDYRFEEFLKFYNSCSDTLEIADVRDSFLEHKLDEALNTSDDLDTYFTYLLHYCYYNIHIKKYDEAFVYLTQMFILSTNEATDKNDILNSNPRTIDLFFALDDLKAAKKSYDVDKLFKRAVDEFKINKYNNNQEMVLELIKDLLND